MFNADDFGFTSGVNRAIVKAYTDGIVTSATLMANGPAFCEAKELAEQFPNLSIGCHVVLIDGEPVLPPARVPSLTQAGRFRDDLKTFAARALTGQLDTTEIGAEATAQIRRVQTAGVCVSHLDTHKHTHLFPRVLRPLLKAAKMCGIRAVRNPFEPDSLVRFSQVSLRPRMLTRYCAVRALQSMAGKFRRTVEAEGLATTDGTVGIVLTGFLNRRRLDALIRRIPDGTWELVTHPGYSDGALSPLSGLTASRETELALLTSPSTRDLLKQCGVELISYRDLVTAATAPGD